MLCTLLAAASASGAEKDICENLKGADLIRCIEAAARAEAPAPGTQPGKDRPAAPGAPAASRPAAPPSASVSPAPPAADAYASPRRTPTDCTGRSGEELRRCLAAGGILRPEAATVSRPPATAPAAAPAAADSCDGKTGDALRICVEAQARAADARKPAQPQPIRCTGYTAADQPLCVHRNTAIAECRNRARYPDFDICMRSQMAQAPEPQRADCSKLPARQHDACEARNRVFASCRGDKIGYFACLERHLGEDAVLTRR